MQEHPNDIELLELVEGDLGDTERAALEEHVAACSRCAATVAELEHARTLLRSAPLLELAQQRRALIFDSLPPQERDRSRVRGFFSSPRRIALVAVPVAAAVIAVVVTVSLSGGGGGAQQAADQERAAAATTASTFSAEAGGASATPPAAAESTPTTAAGATGGVETGAAVPKTTLAPATTTIRALGAATDVAVVLQQAGIHVDRVLDRKVIVTGDPEAVRQALDGRVATSDEPGVDVVVNPPSP